MCRNIKKLRRPAPPLTTGEIYESSFNLVKKIAGFPKPSAKRLPLLEKTAHDITKHVVRLFNEMEIEGKKPCVEILKS